ncbi:MAG TPA: S-adenosylmethionine decarboxylase [Gammaproteobacteria bacterium]|nr:S-adenosylmethionine decarboxylase [Gammaproteobacteria bacterium]
MIKEEIMKVSEASVEAPWGIACSVDVYDCDPKVIQDEAAIRRYMEELLELMNVKELGPCHVVHCKADKKVEGLAMFQFIEGASLSGHFASLTNTAYINIFACKPYELSSVVEFTQRFFSGQYVRFHTNDRV